MRADNGPPFLLIKTQTFRQHLNTNRANTTIYFIAGRNSERGKFQSSGSARPCNNFHRCISGNWCCCDKFVGGKPRKVDGDISARKLWKYVICRNLQISTEDFKVKLDGRNMERQVLFNLEIKSRFLEIKNLDLSGIFFEFKWNASVCKKFIIH